MNQYIQRKLGKLGAYCDDVTNSNIIIKRTIGFGLNGKWSERRVEKEAKPYLKQKIGGFSRSTIADTVHAVKKGHDGVIHLYPFGCMPEIAAKDILKRISNKYGIPVLSVSRDEQTSDVGFNTRLEAFVDMIKLKKFGKKAV